MKTTDFDYHLPTERIAQEPLAQRDASRLLVLHRATGQIEHRQFTDLTDYLHAGDILVANDSRVFPARLHGRKATSGRVEVLLLRELGEDRWVAMVGGKRVREGVQIQFDNTDGEPTNISAVVIGMREGPLREIQFNQSIAEALSELGHTPLPPYIYKSLPDAERYQTVFSRQVGSAAAPTAGLHFTGDLLFELRGRGVHFETTTLHIGLDTFKPVTAEAVYDHQIHTEWARLTPESARRINETKLAGGRLIAVGTTSVRTLETGALRSAGVSGSLQTISQRDAAGETSNLCPWKPVSAFEEATDLFIVPGYKFRAVDVMLTNFHLPKSSLIMLVAAFAGLEQTMAAYHAAIDEQYRFYSFGDAMLII
jgi:S-adenosylmethionine:tRNA ribosyltransferase-isomerase